MKVVFQGDHSTEQAAEGLLGILKLFKERYGIKHFRKMRLNITLMDDEGEDVELVDTNSSEVLEVFEICKADKIPHPRRCKRPKLRLIIDNTK